MNLKVLLKEIGEMGMAQKLINHSAAGTSLDQINGMEVEWYPMLFTCPAGTHTVRENTTRYSLTLYYIDRLLTDYSNDIDIYSSALEGLKNLVNGIKQIPGVVNVEDGYQIRNFAATEKMNDSLAGAYATLFITVVNDTVCFVDGDE